MKLVVENVGIEVVDIKKRLGGRWEINLLNV